MSICYVNWCLSQVKDLTRLLTKQNKSLSAFSSEYNTRRHHSVALQSGLFDTNIEVPRSDSIHRALQVERFGFREGVLWISIECPRKSIENRRLGQFAKSTASEIEGIARSNPVPPGAIRRMLRRLPGHNQELRRWLRWWTHNELERRCCEFGHWRNGECHPAFSSPTATLAIISHEQRAWFQSQRVLKLEIRIEMNENEWIETWNLK